MGPGQEFSHFKEFEWPLRRIASPLPLARNSMLEPVLDTIIEVLFRLVLGFLFVTGAVLIWVVTGFRERPQLTQLDNLAFGDAISAAPVLVGALFWAIVGTVAWFLLG